jgi:hypothetical protein
MVCPNCGSEYKDGITKCADCGIDLVEPSELPVEYNEDDWTVVFTSGQEYEIEMLKDNLDGAGIASTILDQKDRNFPAPGDFSVIKLLVKKDDAPAAMEFIEKYKTEQNPGDEEV